VTDLLLRARVAVQPMKPKREPDPSVNAAELQPACLAVGDTLARLGDKWSMLLLLLLSKGTIRFGELKRQVPGISQRMLTLTLRNLERDGLVKRTLFASVPPRVDYELTDLGRSIREPINALGDWAQAHESDIRAARRAFDASDDVQ
jgi:DNA-binding HxlR family transcriptional regulator